MSQKKRTSKDYEDLGKAVVSIFESGAINRRQMLKHSFIRGAVSGFGGVLGATVGIALFLWVLSWFDSIWFIGSFVEKIQSAVNSN